MKIQFVNSDHQHKFQEVRSEMAEHYRNNKEYLSVVFIMSGDDEIFRKMNPYFDTKRGLLHSKKMFEEQDFSSSINVLAKLAVHLFNNNETVDPLDLVGTLDDERLQLAINAILIRRYGISNGYDLPEEKIYS
jgi:hypothetical protein